MAPKFVTIRRKASWERRTAPTRSQIQKTRRLRVRAKFHLAFHARAKLCGLFVLSSWSLIIECFECIKKKKKNQADIVCSDADYMYFRVTFDNMCINNKKKNNLADLLILNKYMRVFVAGTVLVREKKLQLIEWSHFFFFY